MSKSKSSAAEVTRRPRPAEDEALVAAYAAVASNTLTKARPPRYGVLIEGASGTGKTTLMLLMLEWMHRMRYVIQTGETGIEIHRRSERNPDGFLFVPREANSLGELHREITWGPQQDPPMGAVGLDGAATHVPNWLQELLPRLRVEKARIKERVSRAIDKQHAKTSKGEKKAIQIDQETQKFLDQAGIDAAEALESADMEIGDWGPLRRANMSLLKACRDSGMSFVWTARAKAIYEEKWVDGKKQKVHTGYTGDMDKTTPYEFALRLRLAMYARTGPDGEWSLWDPELRGGDEPRELVQVARVVKCRTPIGRVLPERIFGSFQVGGRSYLTIQDLLPVLEHALVFDEGSGATSTDAEGDLRLLGGGAAGSRSTSVRKPDPEPEPEPELEQKLKSESEPNLDPPPPGGRSYIRRIMAEAKSAGFVEHSKEGSDDYKRLAELIRQVTGDPSKKSVRTKEQMDHLTELLQNANADEQFVEVEPWLVPPPGDKRLKKDGADAILEWLFVTGLYDNVPEEQYNVFAEVCSSVHVACEDGALRSLREDARKNPERRDQLIELYEAWKEEHVGFRRE